MWLWAGFFLSSPFTPSTFTLLFFQFGSHLDTFRFGVFSRNQGEGGREGVLGGSPLRAANCWLWEASGPRGDELVGRFRSHQMVFYICLIRAESPVAHPHIDRVYSGRPERLGPPCWPRRPTSSGGEQ